MSGRQPIDDLPRMEPSSGPRVRSGAVRALQRRERRMRARARLDILLGVGIAILVVLLAPGLAIVALVVVATLLACLVSWLVQRRRGRRHHSPLHKTYP